MGLEPPQAAHTHHQVERHQGDQDPEDLRGVGCPLAVRQDPLGPLQLLPQPGVLRDESLMKKFIRIRIF